MKRIFAAATVLAGVASGAEAQLPPRDSVPATDSARVEALERIVITALRLPTELGDAVYAAARNGPDVTARAKPGIGLAEAVHGIPGVQVDNRYNFSLGERITVRGFGARTQFGVRGVRVLVDGIPATMPDGQTTLNHLDLGTIHSVEVIRSSVASIHGNAAGGVVAIRTAPPPDVALAASSRMTAGADGLWRRQLGVGGRGNSGEYLVRYGRLSYDGYREHSAASNRYFSARASTTFAGAELSLTAHQVRFDARNPGALPDSMLHDRRATAFPTNVAQNTGQSGRHSEAGVEFRQPIGTLQLMTAAYGVRRSFENPILPRIIDLYRNAGGVRAALGTARPGGRLRWDLGVEASGQNDERTNHVNSGGTRGALVLDQDERVRVRAAFGAARAQLTDRIAVEAGVRHDATEFSVTDRLVTETNPDDSGERVMRAWSPSAGLSVAVTPGLRFFASIGSAFETPTTTELANQPDGAGGFNPELRPQRTWSREIGVNGFAGGLFYQIAAYHSPVRGALVPFEVPGTPGRQFFRNAASATHRGIEVMLGTSVSEHVSIRVAYTWTDARYDEYQVGESSFRDHRIPGIAPQRIETLLRFSAGRAFVDLESRYQSRMPVNDANDAHSPAYAVHALRAGLLEWQRGWFRGSPWFGVENLLDRRYNSSVTVNAAGGRYYEPGPPRAFYVGIDLFLQAVP